jgi:methionine sulfoxide reductase heme-binding subunit
VHVIASTATIWYAARAGGIVAYVLVSASVLAGILLAGKTKVPGFPRFAVEDVHRFLGTLAALFIGIHIAGVALDTVVPFPLRQLVVPFSASYRPLATGLGIVAVELLLAIGLTNRLRGRLPYRLWRRAHYLTLAVWLLATGHGVLAGTDRHAIWAIALYGVSVALIVGAAALRFGGAAAPRRLGRGILVGAAAAAAVVLLSSLPQPASPSASKSSRQAVSTVPQIEGRLSGAIENGDSGIVSISGSAGTSSAFRIDLLTSNGQSVSDSALQLQFANGATCEGTLTSLDTSGFAGTCTLAGGGTRTVTAQWTVADNNVSGTIATSGGDSATASRDA